MAGILDISVYRDIFGKDFTAGEVVLSGTEYEKPKWFCYSLEDTARAHGIKVMHETCVPEGSADVTINYSKKYKRDMIMIYNQPDFSLKLGGIRFTGIRMHGGNKTKDTSGCTLGAFNRVSDDVIQGTAEKELVAIVKDAISRGIKVKWHYINKAIPTELGVVGY